MHLHCLEGRQAWDVKLDLDLTPVLYAPVVFVSLAWVVLMAVAAGRSSTLGRGGEKGG